MVINIVLLAEGKTHTDQHNKIENPEINPYINDHLVFDKGFRTIHWGERIVFFQKVMLGELDSHMQKN